MSELINTTHTKENGRWKLLTTVSALALASAIGGSKADDNAGRPTAWIELGGQADRMGVGQDTLIPPFLANSPRSSIWTEAPMDVQRLARYVVGGEGKITFAPEGSGWTFSAAIRYGRSNGKKKVHQQTLSPTPTITRSGSAPPNIEVADDAVGTNKQTYTILDFMAGKDVGLGILGGQSTLNFGVRFAQFNSKSDSTMQSRPALGPITPVFAGRYHKYHFHNYTATLDNARSFSGIGPELSWDGSSKIAGRDGETRFTFDWGLNAAVLFGRRKTRVSHRTSGVYLSTMPPLPSYGAVLSSYSTGNARVSSRSVIVPNVGGFAGISLRFPNAKVSMGYRADMFFNALDTGIDTRRSANILFHGPFATVSIGLGG